MTRPRGVRPGRTIRPPQADRYQAQGSVQQLIQEFVERNLREQIDRTKEDGKVGPKVEVLDPATLPETPVFPNRLTIGAMGLPLGLLAGVFVRRRRAVRAA